MKNESLGSEVGSGYFLYSTGNSYWGIGIYQEHASPLCLFEYPIEITKELHDNKNILAKKAWYKNPVHPTKEDVKQ